MGLRIGGGPKRTREREPWRAAWWAAGLLLLVGLGGVLGPDALVLPGAVTMFAAAGPLMLLLCVALLSRGPLLPWSSIKLRRRVAVVAAVVAAPVALTGVVGWAMSNTGGYAMKYGEHRTMGLPGKCESGSGGYSCSTMWPEDDSTSDGRIFGDYVHGTLYFSDSGWARYSKYYGMVGGFYEPGDENDPTGVELDVRVVGSDAYVAIGYQSNALTPLGQPPIPWLSVAAPFVVLIPFWLGWNAARRMRAYLSAPSRPSAPPSSSASSASSASKPRAASATSRTARQPRGKPKAVTVTSNHVRVNADHDGLTVESARGPSGAPRWLTQMGMAWSEVARLEFENDSRDPVVALFVYPVGQTRRYVMDGSHLSRAQWAELAEAVAALTHGRVTLRLDGLEGRWVNPDS